MKFIILLTIVFYGCISDATFSFKKDYSLNIEIKKEYALDSSSKGYSNRYDNNNRLLVTFFNLDTFNLLIKTYNYQDENYITFSKIFYTGVLPNISSYYGPYLIAEKEVRYFIDTIKPFTEKAYLIDEGMVINDSTDYVVFIPEIHSPHFSLLNIKKPCYLTTPVGKEEIWHPFFGFAISSDSIFSICTDSLINCLNYIECD